MATKLALISFEFDKLDYIIGDTSLDHNFNKDYPMPGEVIQPIVAEAVSRIKGCMGSTVNSMFKFGTTKIQNVSNFLHIAYLTYNIDIMHNDNTMGQSGIVVVIKFYRLETRDANDQPRDKYPKYKVSMDIEEMASSAIGAHDESAYTTGMDNKMIEKLVAHLNEEFKLNDDIEYIPVIKRGRTERPHFLISSDERIMEYDFDQLLFHKRSEFQDVKIISSPSLGNTLLLDNLQNISEVDIPYTHTLMDKGKMSYKDKEILILGGGDGALLWELLKEKPKFITMAEIDPVVVEACRDFMRPFGDILRSFEGQRYKIIVDDCIKVLRNSILCGRKYDVIFNDLTDIPVTKRIDSLTAFEPGLVQKQSPWHFLEAIFNLSMDCLTEDGLYMNHTTGKGNRRALESYEDFLRNSRTLVEFESRTSYVPSFMEIWVFYTVWKKKHF